MENISNEVSPNNNDLLFEQCGRPEVKSEPLFYQDDELDKAYNNQFESSSLQCDGETSRDEAEKGVTVLGQWSHCTCKDQIGKPVKAELSYQDQDEDQDEGQDEDQDEEPLSLSNLAGQVQSSSLTHSYDDALGT